MKIVCFLWVRSWECGVNVMMLSDVLYWSIAGCMWMNSWELKTWFLCMYIRHVKCSCIRLHCRKYSSNSKCWIFINLLKVQILHNFTRPHHLLLHRMHSSHCQSILAVYINSLGIPYNLNWKQHCLFSYCCFYLLHSIYRQVLFYARVMSLKNVVQIKIVHIEHKIPI